MSNVLFDRQTLLWTGTDREKLSYEVEILNVSTEGLTKTIEIASKKEKFDADGNPLYVLPQDPIQKVEKVVEIIETTEVTVNPITIKETRKVPLLNDEGEQVTYRLTQREKTTEITDEPVLVDIYNEETGETEQQQEKNEQDELLYWIENPTGPVIACYTIEEVEVQKKNEQGQPLYQKEIVTEVITEEEQPLLEITSDDERFIEGLPRALEDTVIRRTVSFDSEPELFDYWDIVKHKEKQLVNGTFYTDAVLIEENFPINFSSLVDVGFDLLSFQSGGEMRTKPIVLPTASQFIMIKTESSIEGLDILVGADENNLQPINKMNEVVFTEPTSEVIIEILNTTDKRIDLYSLGILV